MFVVLLILLTLNASVAFASPKTIEVQTPSGNRLDVVDRPSNKTPGSEETRYPKTTAINSMGILTSESVPPSTIRVGIRANNNPSNPIGSVSVVTFDSISNNDTYVKDVLPNEWIDSWPIESLKAGAMAVKMYGWYHVLYPKYPAAGADVDNTINSQVYKPASYKPNSNTAVNAINTRGFRRNYQWIDPYIFETSYYAGSYDGSATDGEHMTQNGSQYWADQGKTYDWILYYYYNSSVQNTYEQFFSY